MIIFSYIWVGKFSARWHEEFNSTFSIHSPARVCIETLTIIIHDSLSQENESRHCFSSLRPVHRVYAIKRLNISAPSVMTFNLQNMDYLGLSSNYFIGGYDADGTDRQIPAFKDHCVDLPCCVRKMLVVSIHPERYAFFSISFTA